MGFKLGKEKRTFGSSRSPIMRGSLREGVDAEANNDGTIVIDNSIPVNSKKFIKTVRHEMQHQKDMETGRAQYGENWVGWEGNIYFRKEIDGEAVIDGPNGRWPEGHEAHPWDQVAIQAEKDSNIK